MTGVSGAGPAASIHTPKTARQIWPVGPKLVEVRRMLFIAVGITLALVAMDFLDITKVRRS